MAFLSADTGPNPVKLSDFVTVKAPNLQRLFLVDFALIPTLLSLSLDSLLLLFRRQTTLLPFDSTSMIHL